MRTEAQFWRCFRAHPNVAEEKEYFIRNAALAYAGLFCKKKFKGAKVKFLAARLPLKHLHLNKNKVIQLSHSHSITIRKSCQDQRKHKEELGARDSRLQDSSSKAKKGIVYPS